ncbi:HIT family protein [Marinobacter bohaiensis]|uniref:HIT family protein n=1 Tax=Marinobacter bohaiensis TaxID=2201898 RepID=UPI000DAD717A|nr:HIT family protein [Marinobacter bohaiensis]
MTRACIFCEIAQGKAPKALVYEDDHCLAFMDIHPLGDGHVLVIPVEHAVQITDLAPETSEHLFNVAQRILRGQRRLGLGLNGTHILLNDGEAANQTVPHAHIHVIPRKKGDSLRSASRLLLHVTGLFGARAKRTTLEQQAKALRYELDGRTPD